MNESENVHASVIGMTVDYLTRYVMGADPEKAFKLPLADTSKLEHMHSQKCIRNCAHVVERNKR